MQSSEGITKLRLFDKIEPSNFCFIFMCKNLIKFSCSMNYKNYNKIIKIIDDSKYLNKLHIGIYKENQINNLPKNILFKIRQNILKSLRIFKLSIYINGILTLESLSTFLFICSKRKIKFKVLNFSGCNLFNDSFVFEIAKYYGRSQLEELNVGHVNKEFERCLNIAEIEFNKIMYKRIMK